MQTAPASKVGFLIFVGSIAMVMAAAGCTLTGPNRASGSGGNAGSGGSQSGGSSGNATGGSQSGGSSGNATGGSQSGGSGGNASGGSQSGGSGGNASGGSGGSQSGGSGGNASGGSGGSQSGGSGGNATGGSGDGGSQSGGSGGSGDGGSQSGGSGGSGDGGSSGNATGGSGDGGSQSGGSGGSGDGGSGGNATGGSGGSGGSGSGGSGGSATGGSGDGGNGGSGGSGTSTGCTGAITPDNGSNGGVTDFSDYSTTTGKWGNPSGLYGSIYGYPGTKGSTITATVETSAKDLHATGTVTAGDYAGFGLSFNACVTVASFTQVQFTIAGSVGACNLELQIKTFDQTPTTGTPPGGCDSSITTCYGYPALKQIVVPSSTSTDVTKSLTDFSSWSDANAKQVVGVQWQVTSNVSADSDAGAGCPVDVKVTNIKFLP